MPDPGILVLAVPSAESPDRPEEELLEFLCERYHSWLKRRHELRQVTLEITRVCNLSCRHCYAVSAPHPPPWGMSFLDLLGLGFSLRRDFGTKVPVAITGGEPLTRPDLLPVLRFYRLLGLDVSLATNGTLVTRRNAPRLARCLKGVSISLDGLARTHDALRGRGTFRRALRGLFHLRRRGIPEVVVKTAVHRGNLPELPALHRVVRTLGITGWHLFPVEPLGRGTGMRGGLLSPREYGELCDFFDAAKGDPDLAVRFEEQNSFHRRRPARECGRLKRCGAGISCLAILADGDVVACVQEGRAGGVEGNIKETSLVNIWSDGFRRTRSPGWKACGHHLHGGPESPPGS